MSLPIPDISHEIIFRTARSGGSGGQNVNKVETMVEGRWAVAHTRLFDDAQISRLLHALANRITADGDLLVKSQTERTQLGNKSEVIKKMNMLVHQALQPRKTRIATKASKAVHEKRLDAKKRNAGIKANRQWRNQNENY